MTVLTAMAWKELRTRKIQTLLLLLVCVAAMHTVVTAITDTTAERYQQKLFERNLGTEMEKVLHLRYFETAETQAFADEIPKFLQTASDLPGVKAAGQFERTGVHFAELRENGAYAERNRALQKGRKYENHPDTADVIFVDEALLSLVKTGITAYPETKSGAPPIMVSKAFSHILPMGTILTEERTGTGYEVAGYVPSGKRWVDGNDLIRFPMETMDGCFLAPFPTEDKTDLITQLSCLHNTYLILEDTAEAEEIGMALEEYSLAHGFHAAAGSLREEYECYRNETEHYQTRRTALAVLIFVMAVSSIVSVVTTNAILKQHRYGIFLANGFTKKDIGLEILWEILLLLLPAVLIVWLGTLLQLITGSEIGIALFRDVLLTAHWEYTLPLSLLAACTVGLLSAVLPIYNVWRFQPCELIGGERSWH